MSGDYERWSDPYFREAIARDEFSYAKLRDEELQRKYAEIVQLKDKLVRLELEVASLNKERQAVKEGNKYD